MNFLYRYPFRIEKTEISARTKPYVQIRLAKFELIQALACYGLAAICLIGGITLIGLGATGEIDVGIEGKSWGVTLGNLSPGAFLFTIGVAFAWFGRYKFRHNDT